MGGLNGVNEDVMHGGCVGRCQNNFGVADKTGEMKRRERRTDWFLKGDLP